MRIKIEILACVGMMACTAVAFTTANVPSDGVYRFAFGVSETQDGSIPVPANAVCDVNGELENGQFSYGFLGTTDDSYRTDVPSNLPTVPHAIDGFKVVKGQKIVLHDTVDANGVPCVAGPAASEYLPCGASSFEGRYPVRFSMRAEERAYYAVTCTVANASSTANADVTLFSERCHTHAQHLVLAPGETKTFAWSVELAPNYFKTPKKAYDDNAINVVVVGENAALASLTVVKQPQTAGTVRGGAVANMNVGRTMWLCDDSTGTDQRCDTPYFTLQNYSGVGSGLSRWAPANLAIRNQGEGGLATGANTHRQSCLLKPGDYLYVEFGHNEASTESYTNNLETYLADANEAGANLVVVSPLERHYSWDAENAKWNRSLQGYAEAGEAWVEAKIAAGARNVAFIDLNKPFADWMNAELVRINGINPSIPLKNAIDYYFFSAKGGKVDATHPNPAGSDWGAYIVWSNALARVAAGEAEGATASQRVQAAVLKGITEGVQLKVGVGGAADNTPWQISDDIISAGRAPNAYWDATVRAGYDYANDASVASVDATCEDGVVTLRGVTMRVMNRLNYTKAVIDVVSANGAVTNRYWSYYNYDASGNASGDLVVPEVGGFIDADLDKDDAGIAAHVSQTLTIASGGKAYIWFAEASGNTWQVGGNAPCSAVYPLEAWTAIHLDEGCDDASAWETTTQAVTTFGTSDGENGISFTSSGANGSGQNKNCGFTRALDGAIFSGRLRVSFKALFGDGELVFALGGTKGTTTSPMEGGERILTLDGSAKVFGAAGPHVTLSADETPVPQATVNAGEWMDVDVIIDLDALKACASVGGSDYETFSIASASHAPYSYFGITLAGGKAHAGAIDDVRIVALAPTPQVSVFASVNNAAFGSVAINGTSAAEATVFAGNDVALTAVSANPNLYVFDHWEDAAGGLVSRTTTLFIEDISEDCAYTAVFRQYGYNEDRVTTWDFSEYAGDFALVPSGSTNVTVNGMTFSLQKNDSMTGERGLKWYTPALGHKSYSNEETLSETDDHYILFTPTVDGTLTLTFSIDNYNSSRTPHMYLAAIESVSDCKKNALPEGTIDVAANKANKDFELSANLVAGTKYCIWTSANNWSGGGYYPTFTIPAITYAQPVNYDDIDTHVFVWNPAVAEGNWNDPANWLYEGLAPAATCPSDSSCDVVTFNSAATVNFPTAAAASNVWFSAAVTLVGNTLAASTIGGEGAITLSNAGFSGAASGNTTVSNDIVMAAGTINSFNVSSAGHLFVHGSISREGRFNVVFPNVKERDCHFYGNNNDFHGDAYTSGGSSNRNCLRWNNENAAGTNAYWHIGHSYDTYNADASRMGANVKFGGYDGAYWDRQDGNVLTIGHLNRESTINIGNGVGGRANSLVKEGSANLTLGTKVIKNLTVNGGSVTMPIGIAPQALTVAEGAKIILVGDAAWEEGTTTNLFSWATLSCSGSLASQIELTGLAANLGAEFTVDAENKVVKATLVKATQPKVAVFLVGGQSNTEGRIPNGDLPGYLATNEYALVSDHSTVSDSTELGTFAAWAPTGKWAYDTEVYYQISQALGTQFYVVKTSYGGTSVNPGVNNSPSAHENAWLSGYGAGYHWSANAGFLAATVSAGRTFVKDGVTYDGQSMLKAWIENIDAALDAIAAAGRVPEVKAIIWHQGESDNNNGNYASDLTAVVTYIRQHVAVKLQNDDYLNLPFFCGNVPRRSSLFKAGLDRNFTTIEETANNNMHVVDIYDLTMLSDSKHFDAASAITFGKRLFNRMIDEGVMEGEKVEVEDCVRAPDFGLEQVVNNTTTWTWDGMSGDIAISTTNICGVYFHALNSNNRKVRFNGVSKTVAWTIGGDKTPTEVSGGAYCVAYADKGETLTTTSTAGDSSCGSYMVAVNVGRSGAFEVFYVAGDAGTIKLYLNGRAVDSGTAAAGEIAHLAGTNTGKGVYYIALGQGTLIGARFVPDEEMPLVTLTIGADRWTTFGNLHESNFELPRGVKAYAVSPVEGDSTLLALSEVGAVNIGGAVVVKGPPGTYTLEPGAGAAYGGENLMVVQKETGVLAPTSGNDFFNFEFKVQGGKPVFVRAQGDTTLDAGKAFFSITEGDDHARQSTLHLYGADGTERSGFTLVIR